jgi:hypothetical protein
MDHSETLGAISSKAQGSKTQGAKLSFGSGQAHTGFSSMAEVAIKGNKKNKRDHGDEA